MRNLTSAILNKIHRKILNLALRIIKNHIDNQPSLFIYTYNRSSDILTPITWKARGITNVVSGDETEKMPTNSDWHNLDNLVDYNNKVVVDVGASLGRAAVPFAKRAKIVYALEPHPENYNFLLDQIKIRGIKNIKPYNLASSDYNGQANLFERESHGIHSLGSHNKGKVQSSFPVDVMKLDDFWKKEINENIGLLKVDVEGFEYEVFNGAKNLLKNKAIEAIIFEFSPRIHKLREIDINAPLKILLEHGYKIYSLDGAPFEFDPANPPKICDLIALPA